jgi:hypothetical protein
VERRALQPVQAVLAMAVMVEQRFAQILIRTRPIQAAPETARYNPPVELSRGKKVSHSGLAEMAVQLVLIRIPTSGLVPTTPIHVRTLL